MSPSVYVRPAEIARIAKENKVLMHTDAVATAGAIPIDVKDLGVDALSLSGNQLYGPRGSGVLWLKKGTRIMPLLDINHGDRFDRLVSMSTKAVMLNRYAAMKFGENNPYAKMKMANGDVNVTLIHTLEGKMVTLNHDTNTPHPREFFRLAVAAEWDRRENPALVVNAPFSNPHTSTSNLGTPASRRSSPNTAQGTER